MLMAENKILVVDDEANMRILYRKFLEDEGYSVFDEEGCRQALDTLQKHKIDVVLLDIIMPGMGGVECFGEIKKISGQTQVIMITSVTDIHTGIDAMKKGAFDYLVKPPKKRELLDAVDRAIKKKESIKDLKPFKVHQTILLNSAGLVMFSKNFEPGVAFEEDFFGGMLTAIKMFIQDTLPVEGSLKNIEHGDYKILVEEGRNFFIAVVGKGEDLASVREKMGITAFRIDKTFGDIISGWRGETRDFVRIEKEFEELFVDSLIKSSG